MIKKELSSTTKGLCIMYVGDFVQHISVKRNHVQVTLILKNTKKGYWVVDGLYIYTGCFRRNSKYFRRW